MKAFLAKIWTWILANKVIAIAAASVLVVGTTCAIVLPIALHDHSYAEEWSSDAESHWHDATCKHEEEKSDAAAHAYTNACDADCDVCGATRTPAAHVYDNACDAKCNVCDAERTPAAHVYDNACDAKCNVCDAERTPAAHVYDNACDTTCNVCGATRSITHDHATTLTKGETTHWYACSVCGDKKDEANHAFDQNVASSEYLKAAATATAKAQYYKSCVCGAASATEYFETDKTAATLADIRDLSKTYDAAAVENPTYVTNSDGTVTIEWYQGTTLLSEKPVNAGTYKVKVIVAESVTYTGISGEQEFTIAKKAATVTPTVSSDIKYGDAYSVDYTTDGDGIVTVEYKLRGTVDSSYTTTAPNNQGLYTARVSVAEGANYLAVSATVDFEIKPLVLTDISLGNVLYKGSTSFAFALSAYHGLVSGDSFMLTVTTASQDVGNNVAIESISYHNSNYTIDKSEIKFNITPKNIDVSAVEFTKTYNGTDKSLIVHEFNIAEGVIAGETLSLTVVMASGNAGAAAESYSFGASRSAYNYTFGGKTAAEYAEDAMESASIAPKTINVTAEFEYSGSEMRQLHSTDPILSDVISGDEVYIEIWFDKADVDATVLTGEDAPYLDGEDAGNYVLGNCSFSIVPKKLTLKAGEKIEVNKEYNGKKSHTVQVHSDMFDGYVDGTPAYLYLTATLPSKNAGTYTEGIVLTPYVGNPELGTVSHNYDFSEVAATVIVTPLEIYLNSEDYIKVEYNGGTEFILDERFQLTAANTDDTQDHVFNGDEIYVDSFKVGSPDVTSEIFAYDIVLSGDDAENYEIGELGVEITKKKLTNLHLYITSDTYESGEITLIAKDGVVAGEVVKISITDVNDQDFWEGFSIFMQLADGTAPNAYRYETIALVESGDYANYELATYDDGEGYQVVGVVEGVANCDVQYDGSCNCGSVHS